MKKTIALLLLFTSVATYGQSTYIGKITDEKNVPLPYANVVALSLPDSAFVAGTTTDLQGNFKLEQVKEGQLIRISSIGYVTVYKNTSEMNLIYRCLLMCRHYRRLLFKVHILLSL